MIDISDLLRSFNFAFQGIEHAVAYNQNLRIAFVLGSVTILLGIFFGFSPIELWIVGIMSFLLVIVEMINTVIEEIIDLITTEHKRQAKIAKDVSAGMVTITLIVYTFVCVVVFIPHILGSISRVFGH